jgi:hypothetical protein
MANSTALSVVGVNIGGAVPFVTSANVSVTRTTLPTTALGDSWETNKYGVARVSGSLEVIYDKSDHATLVDQMENASASVAATVTWNTGPETWTGNVLVTEVNTIAAVDDLVKATISFVGDGTWTI